MLKPDILTHAAAARYAADAYHRPLAVSARDTGATIDVVGGEVVVAVPGTKNLRNWLTDLDWRPAWFPVLGCFHHGFGEDIEALWPAVRAALPAAKRPFFIGHSLGAIVAQGLAAHYAAEGGSWFRVVGLGSPRGMLRFNWRFRALLRQALDRALYERAGDVVPHAPMRPLFGKATRPRAIGAAVDTGFADLDLVANHSVDRYGADLAALGV